MKPQKTTQSEQGQVSAQATEPKDEESEFQKKRFQNCVGDILKAVGQYPVEHRPEVLTAALTRATKGKGATEKLIAMEEQVRNVCDKLSIRTKAVLAVLGELSSVAGISNDVGSYGTDLLNSTYQGKALVDEALQQNPGDSDLAFLAEVYELAHCINEGEGKIFQQEISEKKETALEEPQATEPEDSAVGPNTGIKALDDFLERLSYEAQATAYGALRLVCVSDATGKKMRDYLQKQVALLDDPKQVDDLMMDGQVLADIKWFLGFVRGAQIGNYEA